MGFVKYTLLSEGLHASGTISLFYTPRYTIKTKEQRENLKLTYNRLLIEYIRQGWGTLAEKLFPTPDKGIIPVPNSSGCWLELILSGTLEVSSGLRNPLTVFDSHT